MTIDPNPTTHHPPGAAPCTYWTVNSHRAQPTSGGIIQETHLTIYINTHELATLMCSPLDRQALALGFLHNEHIIDTLAEIALIQPNAHHTAIDIFLTRDHFDPPRRLILTAGCGGGITLNHLTAQHPALQSDYTTTPDVLLERMNDLQDAAHLYNHVRGVHTAILATHNRTLLSAEDIGRHNTIDKLAGKALQAGLDTRDHILLTSGRISSEMLTKARRMGIPLVASRTAPTSTAIDLARTWNITITGYLRRHSLRVYTHPWRLGLPDIPPA